VAVVIETLEQIKTRLIAFTDFAEQRIKQWTIGAIVFAVLVLAGPAR
jgi:heme/copper-type cytochrome/quinol oxidase subunit 4